MTNNSVITFKCVNKISICLSISSEWQAIMVENADTVNASTYWVSAGAEYENENEIWVGQFSFTTIIDEYVSTEGN